MSEPKILDILSKIAEDVIPVRSARIAAALVLGDDIISIGINSKKTDPFQLKYCRAQMPAPGEQFQIYQHAEIAAIKKAMNRISLKDISKCRLFVVRRKRSNDGTMVYGMAKPCPICELAIKDFKIKNVHWTLDQ